MARREGRGKEGGATVRSQTGHSPLPWRDVEGRGRARPLPWRGGEGRGGARPVRASSGSKARQGQGRGSSRGGGRARSGQRGGGAARSTVSQAHRRVARSSMSRGPVIAPSPAPPGERHGHSARLDMAAASPLPPGPAVRRLRQAAAPPPPPPQPRRKERENPPHRLDRMPRSGHWSGLAHRARWRREGGAAQGRISRWWRPRGGPHAQPQGPRAAVLYAATS